MILSDILKLIAATNTKIDTLIRADIVDKVALDVCHKDLENAYKQLTMLPESLGTSTISTANVLPIEPKLYGQDKGILKGSRYWYRLPIINGSFMMDMERYIFLQQTLLQLSVGGNVDALIVEITTIINEMSSLKIGDDFFVGNIVSWQQRLTDMISLSNRLKRTTSIKDDLVLKCFAILCYRIKDYDIETGIYQVDMGYDPYNEMNLEATMIDLVGAKYPYSFFLNTLLILLPNLKRNLPQDLAKQYLSA